MLFVNQVLVCFFLDDTTVLEFLDTHCVQVQVSQSVLQPVVVLSNGDLSLQPWRKPQPNRTT